MTEKILHLLQDPSRLGEVPVEAIPALIVQLAGLQAALVARLMTCQADGRPGATPTGDRLLTVHEAARKLKTSEDYLYRHARRLPFTVRLGRQLRFSDRGIEGWIRGRQARSIS